MIEAGTAKPASVHGHTHRARSTQFPHSSMEMALATYHQHRIMTSTTEYPMCRPIDWCMGDPPGFRSDAGLICVFQFVQTQRFANRCTGYSVSFRHSIQPGNAFVAVSDARLFLLQCASHDGWGLLRTSRATPRWLPRPTSLWRPGPAPMAFTDYSNYGSTVHIH